MSTHRVCVVIPAFNEEEAIALVLAEIPGDRVSEVIVVDNGSTDATAAVARAHGATVVEEKARGYGAACQRGIAEVGSSADVIVILDGDHSDYPQDLSDLLLPIVNGTADFVIGSRTLGRADRGALPWNQRWGNRLACLLIRLLYQRRFTDMGPFRAIRRDLLAALEMNDRTFGWNVEMLVKAMLRDARVVEVPVRYRKRIGKSKITGTVRGTVTAGVRIISTVFQYYPAWRRKNR